MKKNILKGWIPTTGLVLAMAFSSFANGGITIREFAGNDSSLQCTQKVDWGITIRELSGITIREIGVIIINIVKNDPCQDKVG